MAAMASDSDAIHENSTPSVSQAVPVTPMASGNDNADQRPVWNMPSSGAAEVRPVMGAESWPSLSLSARSSSNRSPSSEFDESPSMPPPQAAVTPLSSTNAIANSNANIDSSSDAMSVNGQRRPIRRNNSNNTPAYSSSAIRNSNNASSSSSIANSNRNNSSYPRGDHGNRRNYEHVNQNGFTHRNYNGRGMQRGMGMIRPQLLMGPPSFPASAHLVGAYGGPVIYPGMAPHIFMPQQPPHSMALVGHFTPLPMYFPSSDPMLNNRILRQVEFYFSADNLSRDTYLKGQMDHEGWVPVRVIAVFRRLAEMTNNIQTIVEAVRSSQVVEIRGETIRRRGDWNKYVLPRQPSVSSSGAANNNALL